MYKNSSEAIYVYMIKFIYLPICSFWNMIDQRYSATDLNFARVSKEEIGLLTMFE
jgi:hypothetical protein